LGLSHRGSLAPRDSEHPPPPGVGAEGTPRRAAPAGARQPRPWAEANGSGGYRRPAGPRATAEPRGTEGKYFGSVPRGAGPRSPAPGLPREYSGRDRGPRLTALGMMPGGRPGREPRPSRRGRRPTRPAARGELAGRSRGRDPRLGGASGAGPAGSQRVSRQA
jgi:hypothetical protein